MRKDFHHFAKLFIDFTKTVNYYGRVRKELGVMENIISSVEVGRRLKSERVKAGYNQEEVALKLNVTRATIANWESNPDNLTLGKYKMLADLYGCPLRNFFEI